MSVSINQQVKKGKSCPVFNKGSIFIDSSLFIGNEAKELRDVMNIDYPI